ncbi:hypothetical protein K2173_009503 [Erythroxylum novogranatense]|uniref:Uncharacterized protein n=1 Tax=Erythroxylum novogranatense TaxID=1862640 RepID=A0AAV8U446_9ROSI|nr:hypothetical protein K2173_009503 [Erythroxylum novogranatense]
MEEIKEIKEICQERQDDEEDEKVKVSKEKIGEENPENHKTKDGNEEKFTAEDAQNPRVLLKKPKPGPKQIAMTKVPQQIYSTTERRKCRENLALADHSSVTERQTLRSRQSSVDGSNTKHRQPSLSKSAGLNSKMGTASNAGETSEQKSAGAIMKVVQSRYLQPIRKKEQAKTDKLEESFTFKALPLPNFYHQKNLLPKSEHKKIPMNHSKPSSLGHRRSKSTAEVENTKEDDKAKSEVHRTTTKTATAKESLTKLLKGTRKALTSPKEAVRRASLRAKS